MTNATPHPDSMTSREQTDEHMQAIRIAREEGDIILARELLKLTDFVVSGDMTAVQAYEIACMEAHDFEVRETRAGDYPF